MRMKTALYVLASTPHLFLQTCELLPQFSPAAADNRPSAL